MFEEYKKQDRPTRLSRRGPAVAQNDIAAPKRGASLVEVVQDFAHYHKNKGSSPKTINEYLYVLDDRIPKKSNFRPLLSWAREQELTHLSELTKVRCQEWLDQMRTQSNGKATHIRAVTVLKRFLTWARDSELIDVLPIKLAEPKRAAAEIAVFTPEEMVRIARFVHKENLRDWAIFAVLLDTGIRSNELVSLKVSDLRLDRRELAIPEQIAKGGRFRVVPLKDSVPPLKAYLRERGEIEGNDWLFLSFMSGASPVFAGGKGDRKRRNLNKSLRAMFSPAPLTKVGLYQLTRKWGELAKVTDSRNSPHTYRHFFAISYLRNGGDVFSLQRILGHTNLDMTMRYAKLAEVDVRRIHSTASPLSRFIPSRNRHAVEVNT